MRPVAVVDTGPIVCFRLFYLHFYATYNILATAANTGLSILKNREPYWLCHDVVEKIDNVYVVWHDPHGKRAYISS
jgi:hypothetical protein